MISGPIRLREMLGAVLSDREQTVRKAAAMHAANAIKPLPERRWSRTRRQALPGQLRQFLSQSVRFVVLDIQAHLEPF